MEITGIAHVILTAGDFATSTAFYRKFLQFLGMTIMLDNEQMLYGVGGRTALGVRPPSEEHNDEQFIQQRVGLHHICFRAKSREGVDEAYRCLKEIDARIVHPPEEGAWAPGYYSLLFEDPDGIRLEINHVPGKGLFEAGGKLMGI